jgi:hypothetical protein
LECGGLAAAFAVFTPSSSLGMNADFCESAPHLSGGVLLLLLMLLISILLGLLSLAGIAWIVIVGSLLSVDGLFMSLILLTLAGIFLLNALLELRDRGLLGKKTASPKATASKTD